MADINVIWRINRGYIKSSGIKDRLSDARKAARYLEGKLTFNKSELEAINATVENMYLELCQRARFNEG